MFLPNGTSALSGSFHAGADPPVDVSVLATFARLAPLFKSGVGTAGGGAMLDSLTGLSEKRLRFGAADILSFNLK